MIENVTPLLVLKAAVEIAAILMTARFRTKFLDTGRIFHSEEIETESIGGSKMEEEL